MISDSTEWITIDAVEQYCIKVSMLPLTGTSQGDNEMLPHMTAYVLASFNIIAKVGFDVRGKLLKNIQLDINKLVNHYTMLPVWPNKWSHHSWRVSHWVGGIPSILLMFARYDPKQTIKESFVHEVLNSCDKEIINPKTGMMKAYKSELIQQVFRLLYSLRHNPEHGDIGGLVHIHWINYVLERPYIAVDSLIEKCVEGLKCERFLENKPYCLDFDYIQLLRTALEQREDLKTDEIEQRVLKLKNHLVEFFKEIPMEGYNLHKLPGALASLHECYLLLGNPYIDELNIKTKDIIKVGCRL
ncbi:hypothetical protein L3081_21380 [Colwellia sp. MSW7]|uniref:Uncharacterized protein n=1 Tax=Colwellia maritima TaxID=2912588 RepID=A0ABS9X5W4_9GAMM|nr:hypothetical protein [Colwellia maritima]MCI2285480.1 hypothetical protein [Colwellia maritima]